MLLFGVLVCIARDRVLECDREHVMFQPAKSIYQIYTHSLTSMFTQLSKLFVLRSVCVGYDLSRLNVVPIVYLSSKVCWTIAEQTVSENNIRKPIVCRYVFDAVPSVPINQVNTTANRLTFLKNRLTDALQTDKSKTTSNHVADIYKWSHLIDYVQLSVR